MQADEEKILRFVNTMAKTILKFVDEQENINKNTKKEAVPEDYMFVSQFGVATYASLCHQIKFLIHDANPSGEALVLGFLWVKSLSDVCSRAIVSLATIRLLFVVGVRIATKFIDDRFPNNLKFAFSAGVTLQHLNQLELEFLTLKRWKLYLDAKNSLFTTLLDDCSNGKDPV